MKMYRQLFVPVLALSIALGPSCVEQATPDDSTTEAAADFRDYDGEDLFRGVILGYGPVADLIPEVRDQIALTAQITDEGARAQVEAWYDQIVEEIADADPTFFDAFKAAVLSGDHVRIEGTLAEAGKRTTEALDGIPELAAARAVSQPSAAAPKLAAQATDPDAAVPLEPEAGFALALVAWIFVAVHSWTALTTVSYVAVAIEKYIGTPKDPTLLRERVVDRLAADAYVPEQI